MTFKKQSLFHILTLILVVAGLSACATNEPAAAPEPTEAPAVEVAVEEPVAEGVSIEAGAAVYNGLCFACHGADGTGVVGLGKDLHTSEFVAGLSNAELAAFIAEGRALDHELNTTGVAMPANGGNPNLTESDLDSVVLFIRDMIGQ